jgi:hypothetical protein
MLSRSLGPLAVLLACSAAVPALAQEDNFDRSGNTSVRQRPRPDYEAAGARMGGFLLFPKVTVGVVHDDNIYALPNNEESDWIFSIRPSVQLASQWSRHALNVTAHVDSVSYADHDDENFTGWGVDADGRLDVTRNTVLDGAANYSEQIEPRTSLEAQRGSREPIEYSTARFEVGGTHTFNRLRLNASFEQIDYDYEDGVTLLGNVLDQDFRDARNSTVILRGDYSISPDTFLFVKAAWNEHDYDQQPILAINSRDSDGWELTVGADFDLSNLMRGQIEIGALEQNFDSPQYGSFSGGQIRGSLEYFPTQLTTITFSASRNVQDSGIINAPAYLSTAVGAQVDHELLRNVILTARIDYEHADYRGIDREDDRYNFSLGGTYLLNRNVGVSLTYNYLNQESGGVIGGFNFDDNRLLGTVTLQY